MFKKTILASVLVALFSLGGSPAIAADNADALAEIQSNLEIIKAANEERQATAVSVTTGGLTEEQLIRAMAKAMLIFEVAKREHGRSVQSAMEYIETVPLQ